jgi:hypothetical protein
MSLPPLSQTFISCKCMSARIPCTLQATGDIPAPRNAPTAAAVGSKIYFFGGRTGIEMGEGSLDELFSFDTATNEWARLEPQGGPPKRSYHAMVSQVLSCSVDAVPLCLLSSTLEKPAPLT